MIPLVWVTSAMARRQLVRTFHVQPQDSFVLRPNQMIAAFEALIVRNLDWASAIYLTLRTQIFSNFFGSSQQVLKTLMRLTAQAAFLVMLAGENQRTTFEVRQDAQALLEARFDVLES